ncbi:hypothetical protein F5I97DRAFT_733447 [Phlebopus sp. FC_14]|nr:hypothetical protein F5I97DRAFT_733447 [Phlebopus sp. FC_14]
MSFLYAVLALHPYLSLRTDVSLSTALFPTLSPISSSLDFQMDSGKLPCYRSSYLLRFHPYPRTRLSARERVLAARGEFEEVMVSSSITLGPVPPVHGAEDEPIANLDQAIHITEGNGVMQPRERRLSLSDLVVDLALMIVKKLTFKDA